MRMNALSIHKQGAPIPNRIFVGGINENYSDNELKQFFSSFGNVLDSKIIFDRTGVSKGYGFITFEKQEDAQALLRRDRKEGNRLIFKDKKLNIGEAVRKQAKQFSGSTKYDGKIFTHSKLINCYHQTVIVDCLSSPEVTSSMGESSSDGQSYEKMECSPPTLHYANGIPYVYQNGMAMFNPQSAYLGFPTPMMPSVTPGYSQMFMVPQHTFLPPMASGCCPYNTGPMLPLSLVSPMYPARTCLNDATICSTPCFEHFGELEPAELAMVAPPYLISSKQNGCTPWTRVFPPSSALNPVGHPYGLVVVPPVRYQPGHHSI